MSHTPKPPKRTRPRCKALAFTRRANNRGPIVLAQYADVSVETIDGKPACYAHSMATRNPGRSVPVEFVS